MYNNEVTYHDKWDTEENKKYQDKLGKLMKYKARCGTYAPNGWAPELYEMMSSLDEMYGIRYNLAFKEWWTLKNSWEGLLARPVKALFGPDKHLRKYESNNVFVRGWKRIKAAFRLYTFYLERLWITNYAEFYNWWYKPLIQIDQIKEKYGELRIYHSSPDGLYEFVEKLAAEVEVKIALKGAYRPIESLYYASYCTYNKVNRYEVAPCSYRPEEQILSDYRYREIMHEHNLDLDEIKRKADIRQQELDSMP